ncbi:MAG: peptidyl-prolyl cis-trans isomerase [Phycisphaerae bacterium]|nr:peptidyl-prolyl cis-trans isomerase [Phycisphaerae bacterium]
MIRILFATVLSLSTVVAAQDAAKPAPAAPAAPDAAAPAAEKLVFAKLATSKGDIILELNETKAPLSVANFVQYIKDGHYDGTTFHRVIGNFMIQGGGFTPDMKQKNTRDPIKNEWQNGLKNTRGTIAMARTSIADSATSQFFINVVDNGGLDLPRDGAAYAVFGRVIGGMDVVDAIRQSRTGIKGGMPNVPIEDIIITKATLLTAEEAKAAAASKAP